MGEKTCKLTNAKEMGSLQENRWTAPKATWVKNIHFETGHVTDICVLNPQNPKLIHTFFSKMTDFKNSSLSRENTPTLPEMIQDRIASATTSNFG